MKSLLNLTMVLTSKITELKLVFYSLWEYWRGGGALTDTVDVKNGYYSYEWAWTPPALSDLPSEL
jgi:hypothetical protein